MPNKVREKTKKAKVQKNNTDGKQILKSTVVGNAGRSAFVFAFVRRNLGKFYRFVSIFIIIAIVLGIVRLFIPLFWSPLATGNYPLNYPLQLDPYRPTINLNFGEPDWSWGNPSVPIEYDGKVDLAQKLSWEKGGCFSSLFFMPIVKKSAFVDPPRYGRGTEPILHLNPRICFDSNNKEIYVKRESWTSVLSGVRISGIPPYYYPFDWGELSVRTHLKGGENGNESLAQTNVLVNLVGNVNAKNWDVKISTSYEPVSNSPATAINTPNVLLNIQYQRPLAYKVIPTALLVTILLIITYMPLIKDNSSFLEVLVGLIFGIWGIKQVIIPTFVTWSTILEPIILGLYMCLCISVFVKFILMPLQTKVDKFSHGGNE